MSDNSTATAATNGAHTSRACPAPRPMGRSVCRRPLEAGADACHEHEGSDPARRCSAMVRASAGQRAPCQAWAQRGLPFCGGHDPARVEYRRLERLSVQARLEQARHLLASATPEIRGRALELLVMAGKVALADLEAVLSRYRMPSSWPVSP